MFVRINHSQVFYRCSVWKNFVKFIEKHLQWYHLAKVLKKHLMDSSQQLKWLLIRFSTQMYYLCTKNNLLTVLTTQYSGFTDQFCKWSGGSARLVVVVPFFMSGNLRRYERMCFLSDLTLRVFSTFDMSNKIQDRN